VIISLARSSGFIEMCFSGKTTSRSAIGMSRNVLIWIDQSRSPGSLVAVSVAKRNKITSSAKVGSWMAVRWNNVSRLTPRLRSVMRSTCR
jgi:hypothetical protein